MKRYHVTRCLSEVGDRIEFSTEHGAPVLIVFRGEKDDAVVTIIMNDNRLRKLRRALKRAAKS